VRGRHDVALGSLALLVLCASAVEHLLLLALAVVAAAKVIWWADLDRACALGARGARALAGRLRRRRRPPQPPEGERVVVVHRVVHEHRLYPPPPGLPPGAQERAEADRN